MLTLYFDYASASAVVALVRVEAAADRTVGALEVVGLDPLGLDVTVPATLDQLADWERVAPRARELGLVLERPTLRPPTGRAHLVAGPADAVGRGRAWRRACVEALWQRGADLGDADVLVGLAASVGLDASTVRRLVEDPVAALEGRRRAAALHRRGIGGVPVLELDGTFVGADLDDRALEQLLTVDAGGAPSAAPGREVGERGTH